MKKTLLLILILALCMGFAAAENEIYTNEYVTFGTFEQDNRTENGAEPIEWRVLDIKDGKVLLVSNYVLAPMEFTRSQVNVSYKDSIVREWLNGEFLETAFTEDERACIQATDMTMTGMVSRLVTPKGQGQISGQSIRKEDGEKIIFVPIGSELSVLWVDNRYNGSENWFVWVVYEENGVAYEGRIGYPYVGTETVQTEVSDRVFVLSAAEARQYLDECSTTATGYAVENGTAFCDEEYSASWWLRCDMTDNMKADAYAAGAGLGALDMNDASVGVRPAIWVDIDMAGLNSYIVPAEVAEPNITIDAQPTEVKVDIPQLALNNNFSVDMQTYKISSAKFQFSFTFDQYNESWIYKSPVGEKVLVLQMQWNNTTGHDVSSDELVKIELLTEEAVYEGEYIPINQNKYSQEEFNMGLYDLEPDKKLNLIYYIPVEEATEKENSLVLMVFPAHAGDDDLPTYIYKLK